MLGNREAAVARELTKLHEEVRRGRLGELAGHYRDAGPPRGEAVVVVGPPERSEPDRGRDRRSGCERRSPSSACAMRRQSSPPRPALPRGELYRRALARCATAKAVRQQRGAAALRRRQRAQRRGRVAEWLCLLAFAAARLAHRRARLALPVRRDRHPGAARPRARDHRGQVAAASRRRGLGAAAAAAAADRPRRRGLSAVAPRSRRARPAIRPDAGGAAPAAPALARCLARGRAKRAAAGVHRGLAGPAFRPAIGSDAVAFRSDNERGEMLAWGV